MRPVAFDGCFGWLHPGSGDVGIVLCPGLGHDARSAHRALRLLADQVAQAGYPALRFDYLGTGDSRDVTDADLLRAWLGSVQGAADHLRAAAGVRRVVFLGLRFGATLAALAAASRTDVAAVALLAPVIAGRIYARELTMSARLARDPGAPAQQGGEDGWLEADGHRPFAAALPSLEQTTLRSLEGIDLRCIPRRPARSVLVLEPAVSSMADEFAARIESLGAEVTRSAFDGYAALLHAGSMDAVTPQADFDRIVVWLQSAVPCCPGGPIPQTTGSAALRTEAWIEEAVLFGPAKRLSGILTRPAAAEAARDWAVIVGNSGNDPRYGNGRFQVALARRLAAALGVSTLRFDFSGLGDSANAPVDLNTHPYETDRRADVAAAIDFLGHLGHRRFALSGMCSGGYHALQAALSDHRIDALILINLAVFVWRKGMTVRMLEQTHHRSMDFYARSLRHAEIWRRLLRGQVDVRAVSHVLRGRFSGWIARLGTRLAEAAGRETDWGAPRRAMRALNDRGVRVLLLLGTQQGEMDVLQGHFGRRGCQLVAMPNARVQLLPEIDHNLTRHWMRETVIEAAVAHLRDVIRLATLSTAAVEPENGVVSFDPTQRMEASAVGSSR